jgi:uncharacterized protein YktA (UPF0223 family)
LQGDLFNLPTITNQQYLELLETFKPFDEINNFSNSESQIISEYKSNRLEVGVTPFDWVEQNLTWDELLLPFGWTKLSENRWLRPDKKDKGLSATTNYNGLPIFYCFSSNAYPFEAYKGYSKFSVYALLNYGGDKKIAVKELSEKFPAYKEICERNKVEKTFQRSVNFNPKKWSEINKLVFSKDIWWVKHLIPKHSLIMLCATSGHGKTWLSYYIADCIQRGENFLKQDYFKVQQANVLYIDGEQSPRMLQDRGRKLSIQGEIFFENATNFSLNCEEGISVLKEFVEENNIQVVFIDTLRALAGGIKEDKGEEIRMFYNRFKEMRDSGVTFIFLDHQRKPSSGFGGGSPRKEDLIGSQDKTAGVDALLMLKKEDKEITVYQQKSREEPEIKPFKIKLDYVSNENGDDFTTLEYLGEISKEESKKDEAKDAIIELLGTGEKSREELATTCKAIYDIGVKNVGKALKELVSDGEIDRRINGKKDIYFLRLMPFVVVPGSVN